MQRTRQPAVANTPEDYLKLGLAHIEGTDRSKSLLAVPIISSDKVLGIIAMEDYQRENAYGESAVRLLTTIAASLGGALEKARLFDQAQHLIKETEQRNAELAIINSVQEGLASRLEVQSIYELIGEKVREVFGVQVVDIVTYDADRGLLSMPYSYEYSDRSVFSPRPPYGFRLKVIQTCTPLLINQDFKQLALETGNPVLTGEWPKSALFVPLLLDEKVNAIISIQDLEQENRFSASDVRLMQTLANALSIALENARLLDETQRRADQMAMTAEIGREMSSTLDLQTVLERIAEHVHRLFQARDTILRMADTGGQQFPVLVALGKYADQYRSDVIKSGKGITGSIALSGKAEIIDDVSRNRRVVHVVGTPEVEEIPETMMCAPLIAGAHTIGLLTVYRDRTAGLFNLVDLDFLVGLARQAAVSIENARLYSEVQQQKEYFETLVQNSPVAIVTVDRDFKVSSWNQSAVSLFGYSQEEAIGRFIDDLVAYLPEQQLEATDFDRQAVGGGTVHGVTRRCRKDGSLVDVELSGVPVMVDGQQTGVIAIYHDLSELKQAEQAIIEFKAQADGYHQLPAGCHAGD